MPSSLLNLKSVACLNAFTFSAFQILLLALYPYLADHMGLSISTIIASFSFGSALFLFGSPFWAAKSDQWGRKKVLLIGLTALLFSFCILVLGSSLSFAGLILSRLIYGLFASAIIPVAQALQVDLAKDSVQPHAVAQAMNLHSLSMNLGRTFSLILVVFAVQKIELIAIIGMIWILAVIAANFWVHDPKTISSNETGSRPSFKNAVKEMGHMKSIIATALAFTAFLELINSSLAIHLKNTFSFDSLTAGAQTAQLLLICSFGIVLVQTLNQSLLRFDWRPRMAVGVSALVSGGYLVLSAFTFTHLWTGIALMSVGIAMIPPIYLNLLSKDTSHSGRRAGLIGSAHTLGYAIGGGVAALIRKGVFT